MTESSRRSGRTLLLGLLGAYIVAVAVAVFWPEHIDAGAGGLLSAIRRVVPWATPNRVEFAANIALFVPLGWLLTLLMHRHRYVVLPIGIVATVVIEAVQGTLPDRTTSMLDVVANTTGTCIGIIIAAVTARADSADAAV